MIRPSQLTADPNIFNFDAAVEAGTIVSFYQDGYGSQVVTLSTAAYNDLITNQKTFFKKGLSSKNIYVYR